MLTAMVWLWCVRLGAFLFTRIRKAGEDTRFIDIRHNALRFLSVWNIQGLWVLLTQLSVLLSLNHGSSSNDIHVLDVIGTVVWVVGYVIEVVADRQKTAFREDPRNKGKFIQSGLWRYSRHPNYFGEICMWIGIYLITVHGLPTTFFQAMAAISPVFVTFLLLCVSGVAASREAGGRTVG
ncbi:hypothetical protein PINS_up009814 [Pythium insidiosum]|nr:hypothetical protein PINS_up009814 [Pythium insidiosum]